MKRAFTLIELLIVITIIGILAVALLPSVLGAPARARDAQRKADLKNIVAAIESHYSDKNVYPGNVHAQLCYGHLDALSPGDPSLNNYFAGGKVPADPQRGNAKSLGSGCKSGQYLYCSMNSGAKSSYYVASYVESEGSANYTSDKIFNGECKWDGLGPPEKTPGKINVYVISR